jgi:hypothetical protein
MELTKKVGNCVIEMKEANMMDNQKLEHIGHVISLTKKELCHRIIYAW